MTELSQERVDSSGHRTCLERDIRRSDYRRGRISRVPPACEGGQSVFTPRQSEKAMVWDHRTQETGRKESRGKSRALPRLKHSFACSQRAPLVRSNRLASSQVGKTPTLFRKIPAADQAKPFKRERRRNRRKKAASSCDEFCIAAGGDKMRRPYGTDLLQNLAEDFSHKASIAVDRTGTHRLRRASPDSVPRFTQFYLGQESRASVQVVGHRIQPGSDYAADIISSSRDDVERNRRAKIDDDSRGAIECDGSRGIGQSIRAYRFRLRVIDTDAKCNLVTHPANRRWEDIGDDSVARWNYRCHHRVLRPSRAKDFAQRCRCEFASRQTK
jgi:hypothetical protein